MSIAPNPSDPVGDDEPLLRSIDEELDHRYENGKLRLASTSFNDVTRQPSVDREWLRRHPHDARLKASDGVARLVASAVRELNLGSRDPKNPTSIPVDVVPDPLDSENVKNPAHALIRATAEINGSKFTRLREALARIAEEDIVLAPAKFRIVDPSA